MNKVLKIGLLLLVLVSSFAFLSFANSNQIKHYDYTNDTLLRSYNLINNEYIARVSEDMRSSEGRSLWVADLRYPTIYKGHPNDGGTPTSANSRFTVKTRYSDNDNILAYNFGFKHLAGPIDPSIAAANKPISTERTTAVNVQRVDIVRGKFNIIRDAFGGNETFVFNNTDPHTITSWNGSKKYGDFYYIRDLAYASGGEVDNSDLGNNGTNLQIIQTDPPDITVFKPKKTTNYVDERIDMDVEGFEYVSDNRRRVQWTLDIKGPESGKFNGNLTSTKGITNSSKSYLKRYSGKFSHTPSFTPLSAGTYSLTLTVTDEVQRSTSRTITINVLNADGTPGKTDPNPEPEPVLNEPPTVKINAPSTIKAGDLFCINATAYDSDGTIEGYYWSAPGMFNPPVGEENNCNVWYEDQGIKNVYVMVEDDKGATGYDQAVINVLPPTPEANISVGGTLKENRKVTITDTSRSPFRFPITESVMEITSVDGNETIFFVRPDNQKEFTTAKVAVVIDYNKDMIFNEEPIIFDSSSLSFNFAYKATDPENPQLQYNLAFVNKNYTIDTEAFSNAIFKEMSMKALIDNSSDLFIFSSLNSGYKKIDYRSYFEGDTVFIELYIQPL